MKSLQEALVKMKEKSKQLWSRNCQKLSKFEDSLDEKEQEIAILKEELHAICIAFSSSLSHEISPSSTVPTKEVSEKQPQRCGKAPPIETFFKGNDVWLDDWLPSLHNVAEWSEQEVECSEKVVFDDAVKNLRDRLGHGA